MSALAEALLAAQRQAIGALEKQYVAGTMEVPALCEWLDAMGCRDVVEQGQLLAALNALKQFGVAPQETNGKPDPASEPASRLDGSLLMDELREERDELAALERDTEDERRLQNERAAELEAESVYWLTGERE